MSIEMCNNIMSYLTGNFIDFEQRLHCLAETTGNLTSFATEGSGYSPDLLMKESWNREFDKRSFIISNSGSRPF